MKKNRAKINYDPEADVLSWELSGAPIEYASEIGNVIVHFTKNNIPVFIEFLNASKTIRKSERTIVRARELSKV